MNHTREPQHSHNPCQPASHHQHASNRAQTTALLHARLLPTLAVLACSSQDSSSLQKVLQLPQPNSPLTGLPQLLRQCPGLRQLAALCLLAGMRCTVRPSSSGAHSCGMLGHTNSPQSMLRLTRRDTKALTS